MARAGTAAAGSGGVTGAAGAAAACGALFTARARVFAREAWSIFFVSNFFKEQFGVSLKFLSELMSFVDAPAIADSSSRRGEQMGSGGDQWQDS